MKTTKTSVTALTVIHNIGNPYVALNALLNTGWALVGVTAIDADRSRYHLMLTVDVRPDTPYVRDGNEFLAQD